MTSSLKKTIKNYLYREIGSVRFYCYEVKDYSEKYIWFTNKHSDKYYFCIISGIIFINYDEFNDVKMFFNINKKEMVNILEEFFIEFLQKIKCENLVLHKNYLKIIKFKFIRFADSFSEIPKKYFENQINDNLELKPIKNKFIILVRKLLNYFVI